MNEEEKRNIALNIGEFWLTNCLDDDYYDNCMEEILETIGHTKGPIPDLAYEIWGIIEKEVI